MLRSFFLSLAAVALLGLMGYPLVLYADTQEDLQNQIDSQNQKIQQIQQEIAQLQTELDSTSKQKQTLQSAVSELNLSIKKVSASVSLTQSQISRTDLQIRQLSGSIATTTTKIGTERAGIAQTLRDLQAQDDQSPAVELLGEATLSSFFDEVATLGTLRDELGNKVTELTSLKTTLVTNKNVAQDKRNQLAAYKTQLAQQQQALAATRADKNQLLAQTKNQETSYQKLIAQKEAQERQFEQELLAFEKQLGLSVDTSTLPPTGSGALRWPVDSVRITQYFGNTSFATQNPQIYNGKGHTGMDFAASPGTRILAARGGVVLGTGNTDLTCPNASFGKWVFIKHDNGLSTLYAHLSYISVSQGQGMNTGQVVGFSGSTGYATGPHLHFGVYASSGSEITSFQSKSCKGKIYTMPVGDVTAYLNPLSYLSAR